MVQYLLRNGSDLYYKDRYGRTPIHLAAGNGYLAVVRVLLAQGFDLESYRHHGDRYPSRIHVSPIQDAAFNGQTRVVKYLLSRSDNPRGDANAALPAGAASGNIVLVSLLLQSGADVNSQKVAGHVQTHEANPKQEREHGPTALLSAARYGQTAMVQFLIDNGADINCKMGFPYTGRTALTMAIRGEHSDVVEALLASDANIHDGPIEAAINLKSVEMVELLLPRLDHGQSRQNLLMVAATTGDVDIFKLLLDNGCNKEKALVVRC